LLGAGERAFKEGRWAFVDRWGIARWALLFAGAAGDERKSGYIRVPRYFFIG
jgi:hypothetical protein